MKLISLRQLAKGLGVSASHLSQVESGKRPASDRLVNALGRLTVKQSVRQNTFDTYNVGSYNLKGLGISLAVGQRTLDP